MKNEVYPLRGMVVSLNTPFRENFDVDYDSLARLVDFHLEEGASGFLLTAQAGEVFELTRVERREILRTVNRVGAGRVPVFAGVTSLTAEESLVLAADAAECGCEGILSEPPAALRSYASRLEAYFEQIALAPVLMIQDLDWSGFGIPVEWIKEWFEQIGAFRCLKVETAPAGPKYTAVREAIPALHVSGGWAVLQMIEALDRGVETFMNTAMTREHNDVLDAYRAGDRERAIENFAKLLPVIAYTRQHLDVSIRFHKRQFERLGVFRTSLCRKPCAYWDKYHARCTEELLDAYMAEADRRK